MVTHTNHVIPGPDLHCKWPLVLWGLLHNLPAKIGKDQKKVLPFASEPLTLCHMLNPALVNPLRS